MLKREGTGECDNVHNRGETVSPRGCDRWRQRTCTWRPTWWWPAPAAAGRPWALALARRGRRVVVLEQAPALGLADAIRAVTQPVLRSCIRTIHGDVLLEAYMWDWVDREGRNGSARSRRGAVGARRTS